MSAGNGSPRVFVPTVFRAGTDPSALPGSLGSATAYQTHRQQVGYFCWGLMLPAIAHVLTAQTYGAIAALFLLVIVISVLDWRYKVARRCAVAKSDALAVAQLQQSVAGSGPVPAQRRPEPRRRYTSHRAGAAGPAPAGLGDASRSDWMDQPPGWPEVRPQPMPQWAPPPPAKEVPQ